MHAVVMAAGEGMRMRPITERWPKPVLPIDGRPVIAMLLRELAATGCEGVTVVTGHLAEQVEAQVGDGAAFGVAVTFVRQPRPDGSADAVRRALEAGVEPPCLVAGADTLFAAGDVARFADAYNANEADAAIAVRRDPPPSPPHRRAVAISAGRVRNLSDEDAANPLAGAPLWVVGRETAARLCLDQRPYELRNAYQRAIDEGVHVAGIEIGSTRDLTHAVDLVIQNFPYLKRERV